MTDNPRREIRWLFKLGLWEHAKIYDGNDYDFLKIFNRDAMNVYERLPPYFVEIIYY